VEEGDCCNITARRIQKAKEMLLSGRASIADRVHTAKAAVQRLKLLLYLYFERVITEVVAGGAQPTIFAAGGE